MQYGLLKNNKSSKMEQMNLELINYSQEIVHKKIADVYSNTAAT